jgi:lambda family phage portal protein
MAATEQLRLSLAVDTPAPRRSRIVNSGAGLAYESTSMGRRAVGWRPPSLSPNPSILYGLQLLRDRSRAAVRNDGYAKGAIDELVSNIIGTGIKPLSLADDQALRKRLQALWLLWTDESDADGLFDWYGQQALAVRAWLEGGEVFVRLRPRTPSDGLSVPLQVQIIEPELCPHTWNTTLPNGNRVRAGIEFDAIGRRVAYYFHPSRPGDLVDFDPSDLRRVPADGVIHLYQPLRPGQLRGVPHLTQALIKLRELDKFDDATLLRQQLANLFVGFVTRQNSADTDVTDPMTGLPVAHDDDGNQLLSLEPGIFQELAPGEDVKFSDPPAIDGAYPDFTRQQLSHVAAATGVPYEVLTGDLSRVNDRTVRVLLNQFRRRIMAWQHQIVAFQLCRPVWRAWLDRVFLFGAAPIPASYATDPDPVARAKWVPQGWPYINPVQDVQANREAIRAGFESRSSVVSEQGEDAEAIDVEQAADNARADALGLSYDSDGRKMLGTANSQPNPAVPAGPKPPPAK